jgi:hypothetical protein
MVFVEPLQSIQEEAEFAGNPSPHLANPEVFMMDFSTV